MTKSDGSPVTVADRAAETAARAWVQSRFPQDGILGEELGEERPGAPRRGARRRPADVAAALIGGVSFGDLPFQSTGLVTQTADL